MKSYVLCVLAVAFAAQLVIVTSCPENEKVFLEQLSQCPYVDDAESCADAAYASACGALTFGGCRSLPFIRRKGTELSRRVHQMCAADEDDFECDDSLEDLEAWIRECPEDEVISNTPMEEWTCEQLIEVVACQMMTRMGCPVTPDMNQARVRVIMLGESKCA